MSYITRSGRIDEDRLRAMSPGSWRVTRATQREMIGRRGVEFQRCRAPPASKPPLTACPSDAPGSREIGFSVPERYNASAILFDNLDWPRCIASAVTGPAGARTYAELAADACAFGAGLLSLGLQRGDRVLLFLDDTPAYPAALFGAIRAGLVPCSSTRSRPPDLLQFYLADSGAKVAICDASFRRPLQRRGLPRHAARRLVIVANGEGARASGPPACMSAAQWLAQAARRRCRPPTRAATTWRSGCTRPARPGGRRASCICSTTCSTRTLPTRATFSR